jgi:putative ABC transport system permease protein
LSYVLWKNRYKANPNIIDTTIQLDGDSYTVVGVMPAGFNEFDGKELLWTPLQLRRNSGIGSSPTVHWLGAYVRLPDGMSLKQARTELDSVVARLHQTRPAMWVLVFIFRHSMTHSRAMCGLHCCC